MGYRFTPPKTPDDFFFDDDDEVIVKFRTSSADEQEVESETCRGLVVHKLTVSFSGLSDVEKLVLIDAAGDGESYLVIPWPLILSVKKIGMRT
jgi:hypothetical protein